jgi:hypothetical protein
MSSAMIAGIIETDIIARSSMQKGAVEQRLLYPNEERRISSHCRKRSTCKK